MFNTAYTVVYCWFTIIKALAPYGCGLSAWPSHLITKKEIGRI